MQVEVLRAKLLRAEVNETHRDYEGSLAVDMEFLEAVGFLPNEKVLVGNITNGNRFETYIMPAVSGSKTISVNGAAAHLCAVGDLLVVMAFARMSEEEALTWEPRVLILGDGNKRIVELRNGIPTHPHKVG